MSDDNHWTAGQLHVLVVSKSLNTRRLVHDALAEESLLELRVEDHDVVQNGCFNDSHSIDLIVLDGACEDVQHWAERVPQAAIVALTDSGDASVRDSLVARGATDCFSLVDYNGHSHLLLANLRQTIRYHAIRLQHHRLQRTLAERSREVRRLTSRLSGSSPYDYRTGWFSHSHTVDRCQEEICRGARYHQPLALVLLELLGMHELEKEHGPDVVDEIVTQVSARVRLISRQSDVAGHYGCDSFLLILPGTDEAGAERFCHRTASALAAPIVIREISARLTWRLALVCRTGYCELSPTDLLNRLEQRIEVAKPSEIVDFAVSNH